MADNLKKDRQPFDEIILKSSKRNRLKINFTVPHASEIELRKNDIMISIWQYLEKGGCISRSSIFDHLVSIGKEIYHCEMNEFRKYIDVKYCVKESIDCEKKVKKDKGIKKTNKDES